MLVNEVAETRLLPTGAYFLETSLITIELTSLEFFETTRFLELAIFSLVEK